MALISETFTDDEIYASAGETSRGKVQTYIMIYDGVIYSQSVGSFIHIQMTNILYNCDRT